MTIKMMIMGDISQDEVKEETSFSYSPVFMHDGGDRKSQFDIPESSTRFACIGTSDLQLLISHLELTQSFKILAFLLWALREFPSL